MMMSLFHPPKHTLMVAVRAHLVTIWSDSCSTFLSARQILFTLQVKWLQSLYLLTVTDNRWEFYRIFSSYWEDWIQLCNGVLFFIPQHPLKNSEVAECFPADGMGSLQRVCFHPGVLERGRRVVSMDSKCWQRATMVTVQTDQEQYQFHFVQKRFGLGLGYSPWSWTSVHANI